MDCAEYSKYVYQSGVDLFKHCASLDFGGKEFNSRNNFESHAEVAAIIKFTNWARGKGWSDRKILKSLKSSSLLSLRFNQSGLYCSPSSKPCVSCLSVMKAFQVRDVIYLEQGVFVQSRTKDIVTNHVSRHNQKAVYHNYKFTKEFF